MRGFLHWQQHGEFPRGKDGLAEEDTPNRSGDLASLRPTRPPAKRRTSAKASSPSTMAKPTASSPSLILGPRTRRPAFQDAKRKITGNSSEDDSEPDPLPQPPKKARPTKPKGDRKQRKQKADRKKAPARPKAPARQPRKKSTKLSTKHRNKKPAANPVSHSSPRNGPCCIVFARGWVEPSQPPPAWEFLVDHCVCGCIATITTTEGDFRQSPC